MRRGQPLRRKTALKQVGVRDGATRNRARDADSAAAFSAEVKRRARGLCQVCPLLVAAANVLPAEDDPDRAAERAERIRRAVDVARACPGSGAHAHHVVGRGSGGYGDHRPENGLWTCWRAHTHCHDRDRDLAERLGVIVRRRG